MRRSLSVLTAQQHLVYTMAVVERVPLLELARRIGWRSTLASLRWSILKAKRILGVAP